MVVAGKMSGDTLYINLAGEIDECSAGIARQKCDKLIESSAMAQRVIINLSKLTFMDSAGIGFLIGRYKKAALFNMPLYVASPNFAADKILNLSGIYSLIPKAE